MEYLGLANPLPNWLVWLTQVQVDVVDLDLLLHGSERDFRFSDRDVNVRFKML